jgi:NIPSNAP protein
MIHQLRIYEIFPSNKDAFHDRFDNHAARIMRGYGFSILAMWETRTEKRLEFVYLLAWPDDATRQARWEAFMADEEWKAIKHETAKRYGNLVGEIEDRILTLTDYSPRTASLNPPS